MRWKSLRHVHREFSHESIGERILKIGPHLPKLLSNIKQLIGTFLEHGVLSDTQGSGVTCNQCSLRTFTFVLHDCCSWIKSIKLKKNCEYTETCILRVAVITDPIPNGPRANGTDKHVNTEGSRQAIALRDIQLKYPTHLDNHRQHRGHPTRHNVDLQLQARMWQLQDIVTTSFIHPLYCVYRSTKQSPLLFASRTPKRRNSYKNAPTYVMHTSCCSGTFQAVRKTDPTVSFLHLTRVSSRVGPRGGHRPPVLDRLSRFRRMHSAILKRELQSHADNESKPMNVWSCRFHCRVARKLKFSETNFHTLDHRDSNLNTHCRKTPRKHASLLIGYELSGR